MKRNISIFSILIIVFALGLLILPSRPQANSTLSPEQIVFLPEIQQSLPTLTPTFTSTPQPALPDLTITGWLVKYNGCPWGSPGTISISIKNIGYLKSGNFSAEVNGVINRMSGLKPQSAATAIAEFAKGPVGGVYGQADVLFEIEEVSEANNIFRVLFTAPPPCPTATIHPN